MLFWALFPFQVMTNSALATALTVGLMIRPEMLLGITNPKAEAEAKLASRNMG